MMLSMWHYYTQKANVKSNHENRFEHSSTDCCAVKRREATAGQQGCDGVIRRHIPTLASTFPTNHDIYHRIRLECEVTSLTVTLS